MKELVNEKLDLTCKLAKLEVKYYIIKTEKNRRNK